MAIQTLVEIANAPASATNVWGPYVLAFRVIGTVTTWSTKVEARSLANGGGVAVLCGDLKAINHDWTTGTDLNSFHGNFSSVTATTGLGTNNHVVGGIGQWSISGSPASLIITTTYDDSFGRLVPLVRRSNVWQVPVSATTGGVRRGGIWTALGITRRVRRGGIWLG